MPVKAKCPVCTNTFEANAYAIKHRQRVTCSRSCSRKWKSMIAPKKPIGRCKAKNCDYRGPLDIKKYCPKHFQYFWRYGYPDIPEHNAKPLPIEEKWAL